jgi:hypothetical protein
MNYKKQFELIRGNCLRANSQDIDDVLVLLNNKVELPVTRAVDYYLSLVDTKCGIDRIEYYLFNGSQIQRNYCTLFFARRNDWSLVDKAFNLGLIDKIQAYSR